MARLLPPLLLLLLAAPLRAGDGAPATPEESAAVARLLGEEAWGRLPHWRQQMAVERYRRWRSLPPAERDAWRDGALRGLLLRAPRDEAADLLPEELRAALDALPEEVRALARRLALMRWRQIQLDLALARLPDPAERRAVFLRLFPEPFDAAAARAAHEAFRARLKEVVAWQVLAAVQEEERAAGRALTEEERRAAAARCVERNAREEERAALEQVRAQVLRVRGREPRRIRAHLERELFHLIEAPDLFLSPRERELVRYALRPEDCPILDPGVAALLGPAPEAPEARRAWEHDFRALARLDLLASMRLPRDLLLHVAACDAPEDLFRALRALRGARPAPSGRG